MSEWRDIETAPKDCRPLLLWYPDGPEDAACMRVDCERTYRKERWWPGINGVKPTHWMPLPAVPEAKDNTPGSDADGEPEPDTCHECGELAVGFDHDSSAMLCANCYRRKPSK